MNKFEFRIIENKAKDFLKKLTENILLVFVKFLDP